MARYLRQSTTSTIKLGPFVSPSDGLTPFTTGGFTVKVGANGAALGARHDATAISHDADGYYSVELDSTDTAAVGRLKVEVPGSSGNYLPVWDDFVILSGAVYDVLFGSTALAITGDTMKISVGTGAGQINVASGKVPATMGSTDYSGNTVQTGDAYARIGATGSGLTSLAPSSTALSTAQWTNARAANLDNLDAAITSRSTFSAAANLGSPRALDSVADGSITVTDALWCAVAAAAGKEQVIGTTYTVKTPFTGTTIRSFTLDSGTAPTTRA